MSRPILLLSLVLLVPPPVEAIVIRHDRDDGRYIELGERFPAAASVLPDGSGVLIAPQWVLTAAHVARGVARRSPRVEVAGKEYKVAQIFVHPEWSDMGPHDIALFKLEKPVKGVQPVELYRRDDEAGKQITFVGRGDTGNGLTGPQDQDKKKRGATNTIDETDADWIFFTFNKSDEATDLEGVSGPGDSGGPALLALNDKLYTLGVSVFSDGDGGPGRYGIREIYTRVSTHLDWIDSTVSGKNKTNESATELPDSPSGKLIGEYVTAYNANSPPVMSAFISEGFDDEFRASKTEEEHLALYRRLYDNHFGTITVERLMQEKEDGVTVLFSSAKGPKAQFRFDLVPGEQPKIAGMEVAIVDFD